VWGVLGVDVLRVRALQFLELAKHALERGFPELVLFNVEQFAQLYVKYLIYRGAGDFPKTHYLRDLFDRLLDVYGDACGLGDFVKKWRQFMAVLEVAYAAARYLGLAGRTWTMQWPSWRGPLACLNV